MINSIEGILSEMQKLAIKKVNKGLETLREEIDKRTPEDTKTLLGNNKKEEGKIEGDYAVGKVYNETGYAGFVEYGVRGGGYIFHKPKGSAFYVAPVGEGAGMFRRGLREGEQNIINSMK